MILCRNASEPELKIDAIEGSFSGVGEIGPVLPNRGRLLQAWLPRGQAAEDWTVCSAGADPLCGV